MSVVLQFFKELGPVRLAIAGFATLFLILFFSMFLYRVSSKNMVVLYSDLELQDSNKIIQELENQKVPYELTAGGTAIKVPEDQVLRLRVVMAQEGIPGKGSIVGYEIFDKEESLGSTSFLQNVKMLRALEGELVRTIESLDQVDKARVHLVIPRKELFSKERQEPRASVVLKVRGSRAINKQEIDSISHLVASSVPELDVENITIVDSKGRSLKLGMKGEESGGMAASSNDDRRVALEGKMKRTIEELLEKTLGSGKVIAQVNLEMNFDRVVENKEFYDPDGSVLRSQQSTEEKERTPVGGEDAGDASVANNVPGGGGAIDGGEGGNFATVSRTDDTRNYEISKTVTSQIRDIGVIQKLSIAVLVDGKYSKDAEGKDIYEPRSEDDIKKIEEIVKVAVGYSENRKDQLQVINMPFITEISDLDQESMGDWIKDQLPGLIQTVVVAAVTLLIFIVVIRPIAIRAFDIKKADFTIDPTIKDQLSLTPKLEEGSEEVILNIQKNMQATSSVNVAQINESVNQHPQETLILIRRWLNEEGGQ